MADVALRTADIRTRDDGRRADNMATSTALLELPALPAQQTSLTPRDTILGQPDSRLPQCEIIDMGFGLQVMDNLIKEHHLTPEGAAALVGNFVEDSHLHLDGSGDGGFGLAGWMAPQRVELLRAFCAANHLSADTVEGQMAFLIKEMERFNPSLLHELRTTSDTAGAALRYKNEFSRPGLPDTCYGRQDSARELMKLYEKKH